MSIDIFLVNNYTQALNVLQGALALKRSMADLAITNVNMFAEWLEEERKYLKGLLTEPIHKMQKMEYYQKLVNLEASKWVLHLPCLRHCHALDKDLPVVQDLEVILCVVEQWAPGCPEWKAAALMVGKHCLDDLEGFIISRMFELMKMNMSQTGMCSYPVYLPI